MEISSALTACLASHETAHLGGHPRLYRGIGCGEDSLLKSDMNLPHADILIRVILGKK